MEEKEYNIATSDVLEDLKKYRLVLIHKIKCIDAAIDALSGTTEKKSAKMVVSRNKPKVSAYVAKHTIIKIARELLQEKKRIRTSDVRNLLPEDVKNRYSTENGINHGITNFLSKLVEQGELVKTVESNNNYYTQP